MSESTDTGDRDIITSQQAEAGCNLLTVLPPEITIQSPSDAKQYIKQKHWSSELQAQWKRERRQLWSSRNKAKLAESKRIIRQTKQAKLQTLKNALQCPCCIFKLCSEHGSLLLNASKGKPGRRCKKRKIDDTFS